VIAGDASTKSGETDLRGIFVAEGTVGPITVITRQGANRFAYHRTSAPAGSPESPPGVTPRKAKGTMDDSIQSDYDASRRRQIERLERRRPMGGMGGGMGGMGGMQGGGFR
jgi:alpha-2-macroglobulin